MYKKRMNHLTLVSTPKAQKTPVSQPSSLKNTINSSFDQLLQQKTIGFTQIPQRKELFAESEKITSLLKQHYDQFVIIGIGGSSMGARAIVEISHCKNIHFLDNVDSVEFENIWQTLTINKNPTEALKKTAFIVVSKSGSTIEILWNYSLIENLLAELGLNIIEQSFFITEKVENPLAALAKKHSRPHLEIPVDVGGRFSVLTPVGLVIAGLCGFSVNDLKVGATKALSDKKTVVESCELFLESFKRQEAITLFWFYHSNYRWFGGWLQQLWAESLGKKHKKNGEPAPDFSTPMTAVGACDQHSILQQVAHGTKNKFVCFYSFTSAEQSKRKVKSNIFKEIDFMNQRSYGELIQSQSKATEKALAQNNVSTSFFHINDENKAETLGYLFMYFQLVVATLGEHEGINPFDQPGVALGKELTLELLKK